MTRRFAICITVVACMYCASASYSVAESWNIETVDDTGHMRAEYNSLALDDSGNPHIGYDYESSSGDSEVRYAVRDAGVWHVDTVKSSPHAMGSSASLALDSYGNPHISYVHSDAIEHASWDGSAWQIETVDTSTFIFSHCSLALDRSDRPHISYCDQDQGDLKYAAWNGSAWQTTTVDSAGATGRYPSLALDDSGNPHISYMLYGGVGDFDLKYAAWNGSAWQTTTVDSTGATGLYPSLALDDSGNPHISYFFMAPGGDLKYAAWDGSAWQIETVDSIGEVGRYTSLVLDDSGNPHISYIDEDNNFLKYAFWDGSAWQIETLDGAVGFSTSLVLDASGNPHISYHGLVGYRWVLKYAYIPEPATLGLVAAGLVAVWMRKRRVTR